MGAELGQAAHGLTFDASTATISGIPTATGAASLGFTLSDSESTAAKVGVVYTLSIVPPPLAITTTSIAAGEVEKTYSQAANGREWNASVYVEHHGWPTAQRTCVQWQRRLHFRQAGAVRQQDYDFFQGGRRGQSAG